MMITRYAQQKSLTTWCLMVGCKYGMLLLLVGIILPSFAADLLTVVTVPDCGRSPSPLSSEVIVGEHWLHVSKLFFLTIRAAPQLVIWSEDPHGRFLETLFITRKMGQQRWGQDADPTQVLYWEALPYWMLRRHAQGYSFPTRQQPMPDAVTGATPNTDFRMSTCVSSDQNHIVVFLEVNMSLDFNTVYSANALQGAEVYNKRSGQPALIYRADVDLGQPGRYAMRLIGHAHPAGANGQLFTDLSGVTTALQLIDRAVVVVGALDRAKGSVCHP